MKTSAMYLCLLLVGSLTFGCGSRKEAEPTDMTIPDHEHPESTPENPSENSSNEQACEDGEDNDLDGKIDCEDDDCTPYAYCSDVDGDGFTPAEGDCDDGDFLTYPDAPELCGGRDSNCDGKPSDICKSCLDTLENGLSTGDGVYQVEPDAADQPFEVYCDMTTEGGGWTLVFRSTNSGGGAENGFVPQTDNVLQLGALPIQPTTVGMHKLSDKIINSLRSGSVNNDINVRIQVDSQPLGSSWHPSACQFQSIDMLDKNHVCNKSTRNGLNATDWIASKHNSALGRWYVDAELGYIWPLIHIGPTPGGNHHGGNLPNPFCTFYDHRTCPKPSSFEIWVY